MKKRDIIIVVVCVFTTLACIALTFWGNLKNNGVLTTDAFIGVVAALIGVCSTIIVGFQIASYLELRETKQQEIFQSIHQLLSERYAVFARHDKDYFDLRFNIPEQEKEYPECNRFRNINAYGVFVRHAQNIKLENINIKPREKTHRKFKKIIDCENFSIK